MGEAKRRREVASRSDAFRAELAALTAEMPKVVATFADDDADGDGERSAAGQIEHWRAMFREMRPDNPIWMRNHAIVATARAIIAKEAKELLRGRLKPACRAGCSACCDQLVDVNAVEAHELAAHVDALPEPERAETMRKLAAKAEAERRTPWNMEHRHPCPFLAGDDSCSVYDIRPIVCRSYHSTDPRSCSWRKGDGPYPLSGAEAARASVAHVMFRSLVIAVLSQVGGVDHLACAVLGALEDRPALVAIQTRVARNP